MFEVVIRQFCSFLQSRKFSEDRRQPETPASVSEISQTHGCAVQDYVLRSLDMSVSTSAGNPSWSPQSWRQKPVVQDVVYPTPSTSTTGADAQEPDPVTYKRKQQLDDVVAKLEKLPPIVSPTEVRAWPDASLAGERCSGDVPPGS